MKNILRRCKECQNSFEADMREVKRGNAHFCSRSCSRKYENKNRERKSIPNNCKCGYCEKEFYKAKSRLNTKSGLVFCSNKCKNEKLKEKLTYSKDYRRTVRLTKGMNACEKCGYKDHPEILQVHHKDRNRDNNSLNNLEVLCPNCHELEHKRGISVTGCTVDLQSTSTSSTLVFST